MRVVVEALQRLETIMNLWRWVISLFHQRRADPPSAAERREIDVAAADAARAAESRVGALPPVGGA